MNENPHKSVSDHSNLTLFAVSCHLILQYSDQKPICVVWRCCVMCFCQQFHTEQFGKPSGSKKLCVAMWHTPEPIKPRKLFKFVWRMAIPVNMSRLEFAKKGCSQFRVGRRLGGAHHRAHPSVSVGFLQGTGESVESLLCGKITTKQESIRLVIS